MDLAEGLEGPHIPRIALEDGFEARDGFVGLAEPGAKDDPQLVVEAPDLPGVDCGLEPAPQQLDEIPPPLVPFEGLLEAAERVLGPRIIAQQLGPELDGALVVAELATGHLGDSSRETIADLSLGRQLALLLEDLQQLLRAACLVVEALQRAQPRQMAWVDLAERLMAKAALVGGLEPLLRQLTQPEQK